MGVVTKAQVNLHEQVMQTEGNNVVDDQQTGTLEFGRGKTPQKKDLGHEPPLEELKEEKIGDTEASQSNVGE